MKRVYIVMIADEAGNTLMFDGVYSNVNKAVKRCTTINHFVGPAFLDQDIPTEILEWPSGFYPLSQEGKKEVQEYESFQSLLQRLRNLGGQSYKFGDRTEGKEVY